MHTRSVSPNFTRVVTVAYSRLVSGDDEGVVWPDFESQVHLNRSPSGRISQSGKRGMLNSPKRIERKHCATE